MKTLAEKLQAISGTSPKVKKMAELGYHSNMEKYHTDRSENYTPGTVYHENHVADAETHRKKADKLFNLIQKSYKHVAQR